VQDDVTRTRLKELDYRVALALAKAGSFTVLGERVAVAAFTFATPSPLLIAPLFPASVINSAQVLISTTFNGAGASLALGVTGTPNLIFAPGDVTVTVADTYASAEVFGPALVGSVLLTIVPGAGATQGAGLVVVKLKP